MRMGKKRLTEKAYTNGTLDQVERGREKMGVVLVLEKKTSEREKRIKKLLCATVTFKYERLM
jgi:hypothetical protein